MGKKKKSKKLNAYFILNILKRESYQKIPCKMYVSWSWASSQQRAGIVFRGRKKMKLVQNINSTINTTTN